MIVVNTIDGFLILFLSALLIIVSTKQNKEFQDKRLMVFMHLNALLGTIVAASDIIYYMSIILKEF